MRNLKYQIDLNAKVEKLDFGAINIPLSSPYNLSFVSLTEFNCLWVSSKVGGRVGYGEAVPLPGYGWETLDSVKSVISGLSSTFHSVADIYEWCEREYTRNPFAVSAVLCSIELPIVLANNPKIEPVEVNFALSSSFDGDYLESQIKHARRNGYRFIKLKVGRDIDCDVFSLRKICDSEFSQDMFISLDANQAYSREDVLKIAPTLHRFESKIQWLEQPFADKDWESVDWYKNNVRFPLYLDESIYDVKDICLAKELGAEGIKLKLCKCKGITGALDLIDNAKSIGLSVLFGNGVSSDIGNLAELLISNVARDSLVAPSESSGFLKLRRNLMFDKLSLTSSGEIEYQDFLNGDFVQKTMERGLSNI